MGKRNVNFDIWWPERPESWGKLRRYLMPHPGTLIMTLLLVGGLLWAGSVGALPLRAPAAATTSTGTIAYQGRLADSTGNPITDTVNMEFRLYNASSGGVPLWDEAWAGSNSVQVSDGLFNVMLGSLEPIPQDVVAGQDQLWLGITVGTDDEMTPRVQLGSVPFAVQALTVPDGSITSDKLNLTEGLSVTGSMTVTSDINLGGILNGPRTQWADYRPYIRFMKEQGVTETDLCPDGGVPIGVTGPLQSLTLKTGDDIALATHPDGGTCVNVHSVAPCGSIIGDHYPHDAESCTTDFSGKWAPFYWWDGNPVSAVTSNILGADLGCWFVRYACVNSAGEPPPPPDDAAGEWHLDEGAGQVAGDSSGNGNDGQLGSSSSGDDNDPSWISGRLGAAALSFDGNDFVKVQDSSSLEPSSITVEAWVRHLGSPGQHKYVLHKDNSSAASAYTLYTRGSGGLVFIICNSDASVCGISPDAGDGIWDGNWHHVAGVFDGDNKIVRLYADGTQVGSDEPSSISLDYGLTDGPLYIGERPDGNGNFGSFGFVGDIDEVTIWPRALTASEIASRAQP